MDHRMLALNLGRYHRLWNLDCRRRDRRRRAHLAWMLMGLLPVIVGTISLYLAIRDIRVAPRNWDARNVVN